tara:strand:+ start:323 stop:760 length:438 start_codon:yes stop_codon:yes gene_type:complete
MNNTLNAINSLNTSKYFTGIVMILLNIGSKYVELNLSKSMEEYIKYNIAREMIIFSMAWMGTRDVVVALVLTASFSIMADFLLNYKSKFCVLPKKYTQINIDKNKDGIISDLEINDAISILERAKKQKEQGERASLLNNYYNVIV